MNLKGVKLMKFNVFFYCECGCGCGKPDLKNLGKFLQ